MIIIASYFQTRRDKIGELMLIRNTYRWLLAKLTLTAWQQKQRSDVDDAHHQQKFNDKTNVCCLLQFTSGFCVAKMSQFTCFSAELLMLTKIRKMIFGF